ncbi:AbiV family abortive infection protein [Wenyingzhuangia sp. 2_MG-2023]|nr:AbiV family abortive infection protein [Wenyingzhuangia sp. 2_MG-2023]MDO6738957.1 AbiV family abortive infection protein [Wenyingzhuangia sp. 2_MG-2023]
MKLNFDSILKGIISNVINAQELIDESELLFKNDKFARAYLLSHFAIEEASKCAMLLKLLSFIVWEEKIDEVVVRKRYHNHKEKIQNFKLLNIFNTDKEIDVNIMNNLKNQSTYVTWNNENNFKLPSECINEEDAKELFEMTLKYVKIFTKITIQFSNDKEKSIDYIKNNKDNPFIKDIIDYEKNRTSRKIKFG